MCSSDLAKLVRSMPNTPAAVRQGITVATAGPGVSDAEKKRCHALLEAVGQVLWVDDEALLDPVTALSGSGPAYVFLLVEAMAAAGEKIGLAPDMAMQLARATVAGSGELLRQSAESASQLRVNVTSPGGTTAAALQVLMAADGIQPVFDKALAAEAQRLDEQSELARRETAMVWQGRRQQAKKPADRANLALADYIAPKGSGVRDWIGVFAVTAGLGCEARAQAFEAAQDDYSAIMLKSLADRLAEAFAERLHERARREFWGYARDETLSVEGLIAEKYRGIRPAPGYPACPDHAAKAALFRVLDAEAIGMGITESYAMTPPASVAGFYLSHPEARYFAVGPVGADQEADIALRVAQENARQSRAIALEDATIALAA